MSSSDGGVQLRETTILMTDLVGSTKLYQERGNAAARALVDSLTDILLSQVKKHSGQHIKSIGDALLVTFPEPRKALACAMAMQQSVKEYNAIAPPADRLHVRIGVHHGPAIVEEKDVHGDTAKLAEGIEGRAQGDEILTSLATWEQVSGLDAEVALLGAQEFGGRPSKTALVKVLWDAGEARRAQERWVEAELLPSLARKLAEGKCVLVVGELGERRAEKELANALARELDLPPRNRNLGKLATEYELARGREALQHKAAEAIRALSAEVSEGLRSLVSLPFDFVLSAGLDERAECANQNDGKKVNNIVRLSKVHSDGKALDEVILLKIFGDVGEPESLALTQTYGVSRIHSRRSLYNVQSQQRIRPLNLNLLRV